MNKSNDIVVLGHTGFVGGNIYRKFLEDAAYRVQGFSSKDVNLLDEKSGQILAGAYGRDAAIVMVAADSRVRNNNVEVLSNNIRIVLNFSAALERARCGHVILLSSIAVYGRTGKDPITEQSPVNPDNFYAVAEVCREKIVKKVCEVLNIPLTVLRLGKNYGKNDRKSPIFVFARNVINGNPIEIYGDGSHNIYCVHEDDAFKAVRLIITESRFGNFNLTPDHGINLLDLSEMVMSLSGRHVPIIFRPSSEIPIDLVFDCSKFKSGFKEIILTDLVHGIRNYFEAVKGGNDGKKI